MGKVQPRQVRLAWPRQNGSRLIEAVPLAPLLTSQLSSLLALWFLGFFANRFATFRRRC